MIDLKLKRCPFCGCSMKVKTIGRDWWRVSGEPWHSDQCPIDDFQIDYSQSLPIQEVVELWNIRL